MTTLPALPAMTRIEAEAMAGAWACAWFRRLRDWRGGDDPLTRNSPLSAEAFPAVMQQFMLASATGSTPQRLQVVAMAREGLPEAQAAVERVILEIQSRGGPMPVEFAAYSMDKSEGLLDRYQRRGPKEKHRIMRDTFVALAVAALHDGFGLPLTRHSPRGRPTARRSVYAIVAEAYSREAGHGGMGPKNVEGIWQKRRGGMPTVPGWSAMFGAPEAFAEWP